MSFNFIAFHLLFISCPLLINMYILNFCPYFFFYHCMNKRSEIFPRAMSKWLTNTFFDIDSLLIRILKFNFFFMQFYNKWKMINNIDENIKCKQEHYVSDMFFFYSPNPCNMSHKKRKYQDQPSHSALVTNALLNGRASVLNIKQEPNGNSSLLFFLRTKTNFLSSHLVFPGSTFCSK